MKQPEYDPANYHPAQPPEMHKAVYAMTDEQVGMLVQEKRPPSMMTDEERAAKH